MNKIKSTLVVALAFFLLLNINAQEKNQPKAFCGSEVPSLSWEAQMQTLIQNLNSTQTSNKSQSIQYTIPVIIHVIHGGQSVGTYPNLAQGQLVSQILALNNDYSGSGYNSGNYPSAAYSAWAATQGGIPPANIDANGRVKIADCGVQFCLATKDSMGNVLAEPGIDRINYNSKGWTNPGSISVYANFKSYIDGTIKPQSVWNVSKYMNIWVTDSDINNVNLLGYATFPIFSGLSGLGSNATSSTDGFWCYAKAFGSISTFPSGNYYQGYNRGRTSTHEIGHYLGLRHIWGDATCATDYCVDTPPASSSNFGGPVYPFKPTGCSGNSPNGEMFMNFMDYTNDNIKYMFTTSQAERIQTVMTNSPYRKFLGTHNLCNVEYVSATAAFNSNISACTGVGLNLSNQTGGFPAPTYSWSCAGGVFSPDSNAVSPSVQFSTPGIYVVTLSAYNGTLSVTSKTINVTSPALSISATTQSFCAGKTVTLEADGSADTFTWQPGNSVGYATNYTPLQTRTYTCFATEASGCTATATISLVVFNCTGGNQLTAVQKAFSIFPNPAKESISVNYSSDQNSNVQIEIIDALGKVVLSQIVNFSKAKQNHSLNISQLNSGVYFVKVQAGGERADFIKVIKE